MSEQAKATPLAEQVLAACPPIFGVHDRIQALADVLIFLIASHAPDVDAAVAKVDAIHQVMRGQVERLWVQAHTPGKPWPSDCAGIAKPRGA